MLVMAFAVCAAAVPLAHRLLRPHADPPHTLAELAELLRRSEPPLYVVPMTDYGPETGFYAAGGIVSVHGSRVTSVQRRIEARSIAGG
jgi:hypothetical protein